MMYLFVDTETTGLPRRRNAPISDLDNWPRLVQIAWAHYSRSEKLVAKWSYIIRPDGFSIPKDASKIHGITTEKALSVGIPVTEVLTEFSSAIDKSEVVIGHNISFDEKVVGAEFLRQGFNNRLTKRRRICTKEQSTNFCAIPGRYGYKWPSLSELHYILFGTHMTNSHDAQADVLACAKCFFELKRLGIV